MTPATVVALSLLMAGVAIPLVMSLAAHDLTTDVPAEKGGDLDG